MKIFESIPTEEPSSELLKNINSPKDLRKLSPSQIPQLADELREFLLYTVGKTGGHFGAGLGVVELTLALHYKFETPEDRIVWDVGHQTYPHKILTGRKDEMESMRALVAELPDTGFMMGLVKKEFQLFDELLMYHAKIEDQLFFPKSIVLEKKIWSEIDQYSADN